MPTVDVELPLIIYEHKISLMANILSDVFSFLNSHNDVKDSMLFLISKNTIKPKPFVSVFVNGLLTFDYLQELKEGDQVTFSIAIAGG